MSDLAPTSTPISTAAPLTFRRWAPFLFGSGLCGLVYQVVWFREFRHVFGASTAATSAVLAVFIGGLGLGGLLLGKRVDRHANPFAFYARLEMLVAATAALTPWLLDLVRFAYVALGGTPVLGMFAGTALRLVLGALVLAAPTLMMGGTLPAAARAISSEGDVGRRGVGILYGLNTLGAVAGCLLATFTLLEVLGTRGTLWTAAAINALLAILAAKSARKLTPPANAPAPADAPSDAVGPATPAWFTLAAAALVGFAFFLLEMVWYRMLGPILGGTTFTFGLILGVALFGIGTGGVVHAFRNQSQSTTALGFAATCLAQAAAVALPFALGDRIALLAVLLRPLGLWSFTGLVSSWAVVTAIVVLPAAFIAGLQFPLLIGLLGTGRRDLGRQTGMVYASNTTGAIVGSLCGGFGLLPALGAPGCWRAVAALLLVLGVTAAWLGLRGRARVTSLLRFAPLCVATVALLMATGPTAVWRHSPIGAGRVSADVVAGDNNRQFWMNAARRNITWQAEGVESSVALQATKGLAFVVNGKIDGNLLDDAPTQVMGGLLGALLRPAPVKKALVIGLGTGSTAGWLGAVPSIDEVDTLEIEPAILEVARQAAPVNRSVMDNPKVKMRLGDAREWLLTTPKRYDLMFSEPSNPYRAGIASLFTREYYKAAFDRLSEDGVFLQWVQAYEVDAVTIRTIFSTLASVFPSVETWHLEPNDLVLVASRAPLPHDAARLRARMKEEPFRSALDLTWQVDDLEGLVAHHIARPSFARALAELHAKQGGTTTTDDLNDIEFGFARSFANKHVFGSAEVMAASRKRREDLPFMSGGTLDADAVDDHRLVHGTVGVDVAAKASPDRTARVRALSFWSKGRRAEGLSSWRQQTQAPRRPVELIGLASALADVGDEAAVPLIEQLRGPRPVEAAGISALLHLRKKRFAEAGADLRRCIELYRTTPWPDQIVTGQLIPLAVEIVMADKSQLRAMFDALDVPFSVSALERPRISVLLRLAGLEPAQFCRRALAPLEPDVPWTAETLTLRTRCYTGSDPLAVRAAADLERYVRGTPEAFAPGLGEPAVAAEQAE